MKKQLGKKLIIASLSAAIALSGGLTALPQQSHAAVSSSAFKSKADKIITLGSKYLGRPYKLGAKTGNTSSFDCSSFVQYVYQQNGIKLARGARDQSKNGTKIKRSELKPGDLVFFSTRATMKYSASSVKRIGHVGIYAGNNKVLHTYGEGGVKYSNMGSGWWDNHYVTAVRVIK
ncbi:C40 family peptidase [Paenibacillus chitinolyticus]|uniref:C40 family peptidase n=1 Tax=Paenibacillus chitinolyticus TaxID=79263 RepID=UPI003639463F